MLQDQDLKKKDSRLNIAHLQVQEFCRKYDVTKARVEGLEGELNQLRGCLEKETTER